MDQFRINSQNAAHVQAYIEYNNIVGNADGGKMFTPEQYEEYKENLRKNAKNRVYTSWRNAKGMDCKTVGPASTCLCGHKYREHNFLNPVDKKVHCKANKCSCPCFYYIPVHGSSDLKCLCKNSYSLHDPITKKCPKGKVGAPSGRFTSTWSCSCGAKFNDHVTVIETREERIAAGRPVDDGNSMMGELGGIIGGGLTNFSSMVDGAETHYAQVEAIEAGGYQTKALGYQNKQALPYKAGDGTSGNQKLANLNQKIGLEREFNGLNVRDDQVSTYKSERPEEGISAYDLYNTPHTFARATITIKKPLKY